MSESLETTSEIITKLDMLVKTLADHVYVLYFLYFVAGIILFITIFLTIKTVIEFFNKLRLDKIIHKNTVALSRVERILETIERS